MKKLFFMTLLLCGILTFTNAQNYLVVNVSDCPFENYYCVNDYDGVVVYADVNYGHNWINVPGTPIDYIYDVDSVFFEISLSNTDLFKDYHVTYHSWSDEGYTYDRDFYLSFFPSEIPYMPFSDSFIWKRTGDEIYIGVDQSFYYYNIYDFIWSNGYTSTWINVTEPGVYSVTITDRAGCANETYSIQVRDNVELYRATVDLETNLNKTTWQVTEAQAEYIGEVKVYRDGLLVGTAPYEQGYFMDAIGSDNAARNYRIVGVSIEGEDCPIESYEKGTIHTTYYQDVNNNLNMTWNIPYVEEGANGTLTYFQICKYDPNTGEITVVDQVNASITDYTCGVNQFDGGYAVIAAVFNNGKGMEELSFSNLTTDILGIEEDGHSTGSGIFTVYPNPVKDCVTIEGTGKAIITNALGQTILTKEIDGKETIELPRWMYFVKMNGVTRKIVVE